ncbi:MAG: serine/threonine-protein kinase [Planctomycetota bacterium]|nr:serine/threonine-protein kinase [Planctomycetota bacterium]
MTNDPTRLSQSETEVTITYQSSIIDDSDRPEQSTNSGSLLDIAHEDVRLVDLPKRMINVGEVIGKGGMGVVRIARQHLPDRDVAVKRLHLAKARMARALLDEAMIMGGLEHPNIVPVHLVRLTEDNSPEVVMKYIQGIAWSESLNKEPQVDGDLLDAIEVLRAVCRAVEFAHSRGVIHRDIKPHNVMLGRFGEVYLMDWGIAVRTTNLEQVPDGLVGTPGYLAPEMLSGIAGDVTFQTDVFLLGATLHAVLTGERRHRANNVVAALDAAGKAVPYEYGPNVPPALADLANRACTKNPDDRPESVAAFRESLEKYISLREAFMVRDRGIEKSKEFQRLIQKQGKQQIDGIQIRQKFAEARFGLEQALQMASDCDGVIPELQVLFRAMTQWLAANKHLDEAEHLLLSMPKEDPELIELVRLRKVEAAREEKELDYLKKVAPAYDPNENATARRIFGFILIAVVALTVVSVVIHDALYPAEISAERLLITTGTVAAIVCIALFAAKKSLFATNLGSRLSHTIVLGFCSAPVFALASIRAGYPGNAIMIGNMLFCALSMAASHPVVRSGRVAAIFAVCNVLLTAVFPNWSHNGFMLSTAFAAVCITYDWAIRDGKKNEKPNSHSLGGEEK